MQILENDERNIAITNASLANAYKGANYMGYNSSLFR